MKVQLVLPMFLSQVAIVVCLVSVSASASDAFLPSTTYISTTTSTTGQVAGRNGRLHHPTTSPLFASISKSKSQVVSAASDYVYQEADVRLYQSSTAYDPTSTTSPTRTHFEQCEKKKNNNKKEKLVQAVQQLALSPLLRSMASATLFVGMNMMLQRFFKAASISFPSSLAGCMILSTGLLVTPNHEQVYDILSPGAKLLQKFLMVFLVPNLIVLPLCDGCGSITEVRNEIAKELPAISFCVLLSNKSRMTHSRIVLVFVSRSFLIN
jgi:hypothetical protein